MWSFRVGYFRDPRAVAFASQSLTGLIDPDMRYYTAGLTYQQRRWQASLTDQFGKGTESVEGQTIKKEVNSFVLEIDYFL